MPIETPDTLALFQLAGVTLVAAVMQGAVGFGFTLLAITFFLLIIQSGDAVHLLIIINLAISLALVRRLWQDVNRDLWIRLVLGALLGLPLGLMVFQNADVNQLKILAAVVILTFVALAVFRRPDALDAADRPGLVPRFRTPSAIGVGAVAGGIARPPKAVISLRLSRLFSMMTARHHPTSMFD